MFYPFIIKNKYKLRCSKKECISTLEKFFVEKREFKGKYFSWGFILKKKTSVLALTFSEKSLFRVRGEFKENEDSLILNIQINMIHNLIILIVGFLFWGLPVFQNETG